MLNKALDAITKDDIDALAAAAVPERRTLDYKQELPGGSDCARKEFLGRSFNYTDTGEWSPSRG